MSHLNFKAIGKALRLAPAALLSGLVFVASARADHRHTLQGRKELHPHTRPAQPREIPDQKEHLPDRISGSDLVQGLPPSWRATLLNAPAASPTEKTDSRPKPAPAPLPAVTAATAPSGADLPVATPQASQDRVLLPIPPKTGIAAFESGDRFIVIVDNAIPMDTSAIHGDGVFSSLSVDVLPDATIIQLRRSDSRPLFLSQQSDGWVLGLKPPLDIPQQDRRTINPHVVATGVLYPMRRSGRVLSVSDPASGARLLIGTSLLDDGGVTSMRRTPGYDVWPTNEGVVVSARDAEITLSAVPSGLLLNRDGHSMVDDGQAVYANDIDLEWLALKDLGDTALRQRFHDAFLAAADSSPSKRFEARVKEAQAAFSMGAFTEARGILAVGLRDDPEEIGRPEIRFLTEATALMSGDLEDASGLDGPWPEKQQRAAQLWRALYLAQADQIDARGTHRLVLDLDRIRSYPTNVRDILLPLAAETIARNATPTDLPALNKLPQSSGFQLSRALANVRLGRTDAARRSLEHLKTDRDPVIAEKAAESEIVLDHMQGKLSAQQMIRALDAIILDARLAGREMAVRLTQAEAFLQLGDWQNAALMIDQGVPPGRPSALMSKRNTILLKALKGLAEIPATGLDNQQALRNAALLKAHIAGLSNGPEQASLQAAYGKLLLSIGLIDDGSKALETAVPALESPEDKASAGLALAKLAIQQRDAARALQTLDMTESDTVSPELRAQRNVARAEIALLDGNTAKGLNILKDAQGQYARLVSAATFENQGDWASATRELKIVAQENLPAKGTLSDMAQDLALRLASDAARAGDDTTLKWLAGRIDGRAMSPSRASIFSLLTQHAPPPTLSVGNP
ncbi:tetratricopeptide repeat protein [Asaia bogorensis]|uniref:tetratricopeptide repeat protein n=2 Tax=Asaia TaxID=91914 RepID=UPI0012DEC01A|nr:hypothetical protein [Asaia bogorensis]